MRSRPYSGWTSKRPWKGPARATASLGVFTEEPGQLVAIGGLLRRGLRKTCHLGHVTSVFVHPHHRRRGLARTIMERLISQAREGGLRSVRLEVVATNTSAVALYAQLGFIQYGREPAAYRLGDREWDLLLMNRDLGGVFSYESKSLSET
jgi:ribosomal protein S18 acetylase RimI-like enzyme